ncbi:MAG: hypothetical protein ABI068_13065 [Ktedonobacterales bacterium]
MIATDPLSLVFIACALFSGLFLAATTLLGAGHSGHGLHLGGHAVHAPHIAADGHAVHVGHIGASAHAGVNDHAAAVSHAGQTGQTGQTASSAHPAAQGSDASASAAAPTGGLLQALTGLLLASLNLYGALIFLLIFGVLGYLLYNGFAALPVIVVLLIAAGFGATCAVGVNALLARLFLENEAGLLTAENSQMEGRLGTVSMAIRPDGIGEVIFTGASGGRQSVGAHSVDSEAIAVGAEIVLLSYQDGVATVQTWDRFLADARVDRQSALDTLEPLQLP